jgi:hypothetical protein
VRVSQTTNGCLTYFPPDLPLIHRTGIFVPENRIAEKDGKNFKKNIFPPVKIDSADKRKNYISILKLSFKGITGAIDKKKKAPTNNRAIIFYRTFFDKLNDNCYNNSGFYFTEEFVRKFISYVLVLTR